ncbi:MAG: hypothetical protein R3204_03415 [Oceanospirillum sp.]|nr:hypothetical protein [Oceanospirillum sp.]MDX1397559.1 hypothetical protein [Oceanospirillum sp.]
MIESSVSQVTLLNRQAAGTNNQAQQRLDAASESRQEESGTTQPTSSAGISADAVKGGVPISSAPSTQVSQTAETTEQQSTYSSIQDQANDLLRKQAEARTDQASLGNLLDIES